MLAGDCPPPPYYGQGVSTPSLLTRAISPAMPRKPLDLVTGERAPKLYLRVPSRHIARLDRAAHKHGLNRSEAAREALLAWLDAEDTSGHASGARGASRGAADQQGGFA